MVLVQMKHKGFLSQLDGREWQHLRCGDFIVKEPMVIGHECAGIVEEIGSGVHHLSVGDRVALEPGIACNTCNTCKQGFYNLCPEMKFFATPPIHGSLANHVRLLLLFLPNLGHVTLHLLIPGRPIWSVLSFILDVLRLKVFHTNAFNARVWNVNLSSLLHV